MISEVEKYLDSKRVLESDRGAFTGNYTNRVATGLASLDGSIQAYKNEIYINGKVIVEFIE